jgi:4-oxalocrotonate tautomerase
MPLVQISVVEGALTGAQKSRLVSGVTEAVLSVCGEGLRPHTWVIVHDVTSGQWCIGGQCITAEAVKELMQAPAAG